MAATASGAAVVFDAEGSGTPSIGRAGLGYVVMICDWYGDVT